VLLGAAMSATPGQTTSYEGKNIMATKKKTSPAPAAGLQTLKIGSRVRCTDDQAEGRIVWANGASVKIRWDDGEQVTWRRDSLADRPIEILAGDEDQPAPAAGPEPTEPAAPETPPAAPEAAQELSAAATPAPEPTTAETPPAAAEAAPAPEPPTPATDATDGPSAPASEPTQTASKPKRQRKTPTEPQEKKLSALDAAAKVLTETRTPMTCQELIGAMAAKGYWTSPGGKTPAATLYSALLREVTTKGDQARFTKTERGKFDLAKRG
jgi:HB1, ASXL, restriction endonuclease HTH domain